MGTEIQRQYATVGLPFFMKTISKMSITKEYLSFPKEFFEQQGRKMGAEATLKMGPQKWKCRLDPVKNTVAFRGLGWTSFVEDNKLSIGDRVHFTMCSGRLFVVRIEYASETAGPETGAFKVKEEVAPVAISPLNPPEAPPPAKLPSPPASKIPSSPVLVAKSRKRDAEQTEETRKRPTLEAERSSPVAAGIRSALRSAATRSASRTPAPEPDAGLDWRSLASPTVSSSEFAHPTICVQNTVEEIATVVRNRSVKRGGGDEPQSTVEQTARSKSDEPQKNVEETAMNKSVTGCDGDEPQRSVEETAMNKFVSGGDEPQKNVEETAMNKSVSDEPQKNVEETARNKCGRDDSGEPQRSVEEEAAAAEEEVEEQEDSWAATKPVEIQQMIQTLQLWAQDDDRHQRHYLDHLIKAQGELVQHAFEAVNQLHPLVITIHQNTQQALDDAERGELIILRARVANLTAELEKMRKIIRMLTGA